MNRHLLEAHALSGKMLETVNQILQAKGLTLKAGSAVVLHGQEQVAFADAGYVGIEKRGETGAVQWYVAMRPSKRNRLDKTKRLDRIYNEIERLKAVVRAKVEPPFRVLKCQFVVVAPHRGNA